jgi:signal transduction histidine kinase
MTWNYAYTPYIWPSFVTALVLLALFVYSWRRRSSVPSALPFAFGTLFAILWMVGSGMETAAVDASAKIFWVKFQTVWHIPAVTAITCFILEYTWPKRWLTRRSLAVLSVAPILYLVLAVTNDLHHLIWRGFIYDGTVIPLGAPVIRSFIAYGYCLGLINLIAFAWLFMHSPAHRWPVVFMAAGQILARVVYMLDQIHVLQSELPLNVIGLSLVYPLYAVALFRFRIFDPIPLARHTVIAQMREGVLVLDAQERIASFNPAAKRILLASRGGTAAHFIGQPVAELLPAYPDRQSVGPGATEIEFSLGIDPAMRCYTLAISFLKDWHGLEVGRLLLLHDVTEQKQAQAQIVAQQRTLATLQERERLARELHDSTSQVLGYVSLEAHAIRKRVEGKDLPEVEAQLTRLAEVAQAAHLDVRESILSLTAGKGGAWSFQAALQQYLDAYQKQYAIQAVLDLPDAYQDGLFDPQVGVQLLRVIQEALTNARKHGRARCVQVSFTAQDSGDGTRILIADDGAGFDPDRLSGDIKDHYGLQFMHERMQQIGGRLQVDSAPGRGTRVMLQIQDGHNNARSLNG